jgi:hypothetical protein
MLLRLAFLALLLMPVPAAAQTLIGNWTFAIGQVGIFQFRVEREGEQWQAIWLRPKSFASNGVVFQNVNGPPIDVPASRSREVGEWVEFTFDDPRPGAVPDVFMLRALPGGTAEAVYSGTGFAPFELNRALAREPLGPWDPAAQYQRPGLDLAAAGPPIQFSTGVSAIVTRLTKLIEAQEQNESAGNAGDSAVPPPAEVEIAPAPPSPPPQEPARPPVMIGR